MSKQMKQSKASKPRGSKKGTECHHEPVVDAVVEPYTVIIHDPELKRIIEERKKAEELIQLVVEPEVEILLEPVVEEPVVEEPIVEEPVVCPEVEQENMSTPDEYVAKYSSCNTKVLNPQTNRYVACDGAIAKKFSLCR